MVATELDSHTIIDWLLRDGVHQQPASFVEGLAHRLSAQGLALDRFTINFGLLHPSLLAAGIQWRRGEPLRFTRFDYANRDSKIYEHSPLRTARETGKWLHLDLAETPDEAYGIVAELKEMGLRHYHVVPLHSATKAPMTLTLATTSADDFSDAQKALVLAILPAVAAVVEIDTLRSTFSEVLAAYVGREPARQIIEGSVHRGNVTEVRAAILVADLRGFTRLSTQLPPEATADVINRYYDVVVPAIEARGGEVLKFIGDAVLAIFPAKQYGDDGAILRALDASRAALGARPEPYEINGRRFPIHFGIAIHFGEAVYGNVGTGHRLDFTVIGRDVNIAARIASLCSRLGRDYLVSEKVATVGAAHGRPMQDAGAHDVRGIDAPVHVFVPDVDAIGPETDDGVSQGHWMAPTTA
ncbi:MAG: adenylate/guanylate cyclase domain-containing protein [Acuticoccus sp.]